MSDDSTISMPWDCDAEKGVLSCFLHSPDLLLEADASFRDDLFYHPCHQRLYKAMQSMRAANKPVEYIALTNYLRDGGMLDAIGGAGFLSELLNFVPTPAHFGYYVGILRDKATRRDVIKASDEVKAQAALPEHDERALLDLAADRFHKLTLQGVGPGRKTFNEITMDYMETFEKRLRGEVQTGIPTRWASINATFSGITPHMWLVAGFPSDGKSTLVQNMIEDVLAAGRHAVLFSYESDETEITDRLVCSLSQIPSEKIFSPRHNPPSRDEMHRITRAITKLRACGLHLRCEATYTPEQVVAEARALMLKHPLGIVAVDYLQLIPTAGKKFGTRAEEVAHISRTLKRGSAQLGIPFVVLSQLNDDGKTKESRAPNQDAHNILFIKSKDKCGEDEQPGLRVVKNRNGKRGDLLPITLDGAHFTFRERKGGQS